MLEKGQAGLIVVYATNMADQIAANIKAVNRYVSEAIDANADELAKQLNEAGNGSTRRDQPVDGGRSGLRDHAASTSPLTC